MKTTFKIAARNVRLGWKRYIFISAAIAIATCVMTIITGATGSMIGSMQDKAARFFSGHVGVVGYSGSPGGLKGVDELERALKKIAPEASGIARRTVYYRSDAMLYFNGNSARQRRLVGIDSDVERVEFNRMRFVSGGFNGMESPGGILISETVADTLMARPGDDVTLYLTTESGQFNMVTFVVSGVFDESEIFGYASYLNRSALNAAVGTAPEFATELAVYKRRGISLAAFTERIRAGLESAGFPAFPRIGSKDRLNELISGQPDYHLAVLSMDAHLKQVRDLMTAFLAITYAVLAVFLCIIAVGILNTFRIIAHERVRETGTMRALGMSRSQVVGLYSAETVIVVAASIVAGTVAGCGILALIGIFDMASLPAAGLFMEKGHLRFGFDAGAMFLNAAIVLAISLAATLDPAIKASRVEPVQALRMEV